MLRRAQHSFSAVSATAGAIAPVVSTRHAEAVAVEAVDGRYFSVTGVRVPMGRAVTEADVLANAHVVVLSDEFWRRHYAADAGVLGRLLKVNDQPFEVVGVARPGFAGLSGRGLGTKMWVPLSSLAAVRPSDGIAAPPGDKHLTVIARLAPGETILRASSELRTIGQQIDQSVPLAQAGAGPRQVRSWQARSIQSLDQDDTGAKRAGMLLVALVGMVLVVACTNLSNLVLARGTARQGELAVRMAMGASRMRLVWEQCVESILLAVGGGLASYLLFLAISAWMTRDFLLVVPMLGRVTLAVRPALDAGAIGIAATALVLSLLVFGLEPAVQLARTLDIRAALAANASGVRPRTGRQRMIIRWQVAIATGFFIVATMFIRATVEQARHDSGVELDGLAVASFTLTGDRWDTPRIRRAIARLQDEASTESAIATVAVSTGLPFGMPTLQAMLARPGDEAAPSAMSASVIAALPSIFQTLRVKIVRGRGLSESDGAAAPPVAVVSELSARQLLPATDPIGQPILVALGGDRLVVTIVGVSGDTDVRALNGPRRPLIFLPLAQQIGPSLTVTARASGRTSSAITALHAAIARADPDLAVDVIGDARELLSGPFEILRSAGRGALYLGGMTLLLSMVGLFGVQSHIVSSRTREFGVRISLGATANQIRSLVLRDGARPVLEGLALGIWGGVAGRFIVRSYVDIDIAVLDPWMLAVTPIPIALAAVAACYLPATRAARVDPTTALRYE